MIKLIKRILYKYTIDNDNNNKYLFILPNKYYINIIKNIYININKKKFGIIPNIFISKYKFIENISNLKIT
ncbi:MAG: hypothetical protein NHG00_00400, partial [Candidatus Shikimatogenerans sp. JK-2022]|nr:hypothetical protein [Candidatus Shikimatogenerans bostrichidophilus]